LPSRRAAALATRTNWSHYDEVFDLDALLSDLARCAQEDDTRRAAKELLERALVAPGAIADAFAPTRGGITLLHSSADLTVINVAWAPGMQIMPHDHHMWAIIGIYAGVEDNTFFRRNADRGLVSTTGRRLDTGDVCVLGSDTIHAVANPTARLTGAIHIYGGDFVHEPRSQWGPGDLVERPYDMAEVDRMFHDANVVAGLATP
jgi:predicted metal-dependent enzyme (double-stranded beta helix superfamily)